LVVSYIFYTVIPGIIFSPLIQGYVSSLGGSTTNQFGWQNLPIGQPQIAGKLSGLKGLK
jgi:hypothetical protein